LANHGHNALHFAGWFNLPIPLRYAYAIGVSHINLGEAQEKRLQLFEPKASFAIV
jgi:hypothetical protein